MTKTQKMENGVPVVNTSGRRVMVEGYDKSRQTVARLLQLNRPWGAGLNESSFIGLVPEDQYALAAAAQKMTSDAFDQLIRLQAQYQLVDRTPEERLVSFIRLYVVPDEESKTDYTMRADFLTEAGQSVVSSVLLSLAGGG